jgi:hypothetical protein
MDGVKQENGAACLIHIDCAKPRRCLIGAIFISDMPPIMPPAVGGLGLGYVLAPSGQPLNFGLHYLQFLPRLFKFMASFSDTERDYGTLTRVNTQFVRLTD